MLKAFWQIWRAWIFGIAALAIAIAAIISSSPSFQVCNNDSSYQSNPEQLKENHSFFSSAVPTRATVHCVGIFIDQNHDAISAVATVVIALFTISLWWAAAGQYDLINQQIKLAREEFISTHRPRIRLRRIRPILGPGGLKTDEPVEALIVAANIGDTRATISEICADIFIVGQPSYERPVQIEHPLIEPGKQTNINVRGQRLTQSQIVNISADKMTLHMLGSISYRDANGTIRKTSFARRYDTRLNRFVEVPADDPDKDREYED